MTGDRGGKGLVTLKGQRGGKCEQSTVGGEGMEAEEIRHRRMSDGSGPRWGREVVAFTMKGRGLNQIPRSIPKEVKSLSHVRLFASPWTAAHKLLCPWDFPGKSTGVGAAAFSKVYS